MQVCVGFSPFDSDSPSIEIITCPWLNEIMILNKYLGRKGPQGPREARLFSSRTNDPVTEIENDVFWCAVREDFPPWVLLEQEKGAPSAGYLGRLGRFERSFSGIAQRPFSAHFWNTCPS